MARVYTKNPTAAKISTVDIEYANSRRNCFAGGNSATIRRWARRLPSHFQRIRNTSPAPNRYRNRSPIRIPIITSHIWVIARSAYREIRSEKSAWFSDFGLGEVEEAL